MRKYRSDGFSINPGLNWKALKKANFLYLFVSWNVFAYCAYSWYTEKKVKDKEKWNKMSSCTYTAVLSGSRFLRSAFIPRSQENNRCENV